MNNLILRATIFAALIGFGTVGHAKQHDGLNERSTTDAVTCPQTPIQVDVRTGEVVVDSLLQLPLAEYLKNCVFTIDEKGRLQILGSKKEFRKKESILRKTPWRPDMNEDDGGNGGGSDGSHHRGHGEG